MIKIQVIIYGTITDFYYRLVRLVDGKQWDNVNLELNRKATYADTAISITRDVYIPGYPITLPSNLPNGDYHLLVYDAAAPANTDDPVQKKGIAWDGEMVRNMFSL